MCLVCRFKRRTHIYQPHWGHTNNIDQHRTSKYIYTSGQKGLCIPPSHHLLLPLYKTRYLRELAAFRSPWRRWRRSLLYGATTNPTPPAWEWATTGVRTHTMWGCVLTKFRLCWNGGNRPMLFATVRAILAWNSSYLSELRHNRKNVVLAARP